MLEDSEPSKIFGKITQLEKSRASLIDKIEEFEHQLEKNTNPELVYQYAEFLRRIYNYFDGADKLLKKLEERD